MIRLKSAKRIRPFPFFSFDISMDFPEKKNLPTRSVHVFFFPLISPENDREGEKISEWRAILKKNKKGRRKQEARM